MIAKYSEELTKQVTNNIRPQVESEAAIKMRSIVEAQIRRETYERLYGTEGAPSAPSKS